MPAARPVTASRAGLLRRYAQEVTIVDAPTLALALISAVLLVRFKVNPAWLIVSAATLGALLPPGS